MLSIKDSPIVGLALLAGSLLFPLRSPDLSPQFSCCRNSLKTSYIYLRRYNKLQRTVRSSLLYSQSHLPYDSVTWVEVDYQLDVWRATYEVHIKTNYIQYCSKATPNISPKCGITLKQVLKARNCKVSLFLEYLQKLFKHQKYICF